MKHRCQSRISPDCLGLTENWERAGGSYRCWNCGRLMRIYTEAQRISKKANLEFVLIPEYKPTRLERR